MCQKQTAVSHSSSGSEIISLDTGLRLDGLPALELWDLIVSVFGNASHVSDRTVQSVNGKNISYNKIDVVQDIDSVPSNVQSSNISDRTGQLVNGQNKSYHKIDAMQDIDSVHSNVQSASREALLYVIEDNEAVINNYYERQKFFNETRFQNPQSCS